MARRAVRGFSRGVRRKVDWSASTPQASLNAVAAGSAALLQTFVAIVGGETVIRTRGSVGWQSDQAVADEVQLGAFGICVVSEQAATIGITAVPHPATDAAWGGWLWHSYFQSKLEFLSAVGLEPNFMHTMVVDSKAMRKVLDDEILCVVVENSHATFGIDVADSFRFLTKVN